MKELVEVIAKALVENPDEVAVTESVKDDEIVVELKVAASDMGKVIGKQGRIAKAIRSVVKAAASKDDKKVIVRGASRLSPAGKRCRVQRLPEAVKGQEIGWNSFSGWGLSPPPMESRGKSRYFPQQMM